MINDGDQIGAVAIYLNELSAGAAGVVGGVIGAEEEGQVFYFWGVAGGWEDVVEDCEGLFRLVAAGDLLGL